MNLAAAHSGRSPATRALRGRPGRSRGGRGPAPPRMILPADRGSIRPAEKAEWRRGPGIRIFVRGLSQAVRLRWAMAEACGRDHGNRERGERRTCGFPSERSCRAARAQSGADRICIVARCGCPRAEGFRGLWKTLELRYLSGTRPARRLCRRTRAARRRDSRRRGTGHVPFCDAACECRRRGLRRRDACMGRGR